MDKPKMKFYAIFFVLAFISNTIIEAIVIQAGVVVYDVYPKFLGIAWFTYALYLPWIFTAYLGGNWLGRKTKLSRLIFYFIIGALFAFIFDQFATNYGWYHYEFSSVFWIGKVPIEDFFAVGLMITASVFLSDWLSRRILKFQRS